MEGEQRAAVPRLKEVIAWLACDGGGRAAGSVMHLGCPPLLESAALTVYGAEYDITPPDYCTASAACYFVPEDQDEEEGQAFGTVVITAREDSDECPCERLRLAVSAAEVGGRVAAAMPLHLASACLEHAQLRSALLRACRLTRIVLIPSEVAGGIPQVCLLLDKQCNMAEVLLPAGAGAPAPLAVNAALPYGALATELRRYEPAGRLLLVPGAPLFLAASQIEAQAWSLNPQDYACEYE